MHKNNLSRWLGCIGILAFISILFSSLPTYADDDSEIDIVNVTVPVSCTLDGTGMDSHVAEIKNNNYETEIGSTTLTAYCNDANGFSIYAIGYSDDTYGNTDLIGQATDELIPTGTTLDGSVSDWAMKLSTTANATYPITLKNGYGSYSVVPTTYIQVAERQAATDVGTAAIGSVLTTTYAASVSPTQVADTYVGKVRYTLVHPYTEVPLQPQTTQAGKICYYPNGSNVEGTMGCQTIPASETTDDVSPTSATLLASNFSRDGYGFAGWSTTFDYATTGEDAHFYGPNETISYTEGKYTGTNNGLSLYAIWIKSAGNLQDTAKVAELCGTGTNALIAASTDGTANLSSVSALTDQRDSNTYAIAKLADGKCWMIENLRLEAEDTRTPEKQALAQGYGTSATYGNFSGLADAESTGFTDTYTANSLYYSGTQEGTASIDIGTSDYPAYRMPRYNNLNTPANANDRPQNPTSNTFTDDNTTAGMYSYGNYYTWHAAIANTIYYNGPTTQDADGKTSETVNTSLCPTGWRLPYGRSTGNGTVAGGFYYLNYKINNDTNAKGSIASLKIRSFPNNFLYSGDSMYNRGSGGFYWSSTATGNDNSYFLYLYSSNAYPGTTNSSKDGGYSIRCTASAG